MDRTPETSETLETLPQAIGDRLRRLDRSQPIVDPRTDRAVLDAAQAYFRARPARFARKRWAVPFAAAATLVLAAIFVRPFVFDTAPARDDVDGSGRVEEQVPMQIERDSVAIVKMLSVSREMRLMERRQGEIRRPAAIAQHPNGDRGVRARHEHVDIVHCPQTRIAVDQHSERRPLQEHRAYACFLQLIKEWPDRAEEVFVGGSRLPVRIAQAGLVDAEP